MAELANNFLHRAILGSQELPLEVLVNARAPLPLAEDPGSRLCIPRVRCARSCFLSIRTSTWAHPHHGVLAVETTRHALPAFACSGACGR